MAGTTGIGWCDATANFFIGGAGGDNPTKWPEHLRVQQMPRVFDDDPPYVPKNLPAAVRSPTLL